MRKIITISREYRSRGHLIAEQLSKILEVPFYDKELIELSAEHSGLSPDFIESNEQKISSGLMYNLMLGSNTPALGGTGMAGSISSQPTVSLPDQLFNAQREVILSLAKKGPCIIVGRCADFILENCSDFKREDLLNVFVYAPFEDRVKYHMELKGEDRAAAEKKVKRSDKFRANHYSTFTERTWGNRENYDLMINSSLLGVEATADLIADIARKS